MTSWIADQQASERYPCYTRANAGEINPDPVTPLSSTWGLGGPGELGWRDAFSVATARMEEFEPGRIDLIGVMGGYLFLNMSWTRVFGVRMPGMTPEMVDLQYFGDMPGITPYADEARPTDEDPEATARLGAWAQWAFTQTDTPYLVADRAQVEDLVARCKPLDAMTDQELVDFGRSLLPLYRRLFARHIEMSALAGIGLGTVAQIAAAVGRPELALILVAGLGDVDSAAPSFAMWDLSRLVAASRSLTAAFAAGLDGLAPRFDELASAGDEAAASFAGRFHELIRQFASRGPNEWELRRDTWGTDPRLVLAAIDRMRLAPDGDAPADRSGQRAAEREVATAEVRALLAGAGAEAQAQFEGGLSVAHVFNRGRERSKTTIILVVHQQRLAARALGQRLAARGVLAAPEHVFLFADHELDLLVRAASDGAAGLALPDHHAVALEREAFYRSLFEREPPFVTFGPPPPPDTWPLRTRVHATAARGDVLTGIPGSPGIAEGRARIVLDPADPGDLEPGDILVAPLTDPAWTPLFVPASAVVVNVGAQITHAVIVSRELGLPCVVSVTGATERIPDGARIRVDGSAGTVTLL